VAFVAETEWCADFLLRHLDEQDEYAHDVPGAAGVMLVGFASIVGSLIRATSETHPSCAAKWRRVAELVGIDEHTGELVGRAAS
jgi:hypothetical protein